MLTINPETIAQEIKEKGLSASTFVAMPFWQDMQKAMDDEVDRCLRDMEKAGASSPEVKANLMDKWVWTKHLVAWMKNIPEAAIEAAREEKEEKELSNV